MRDLASSDRAQRYLRRNSLADWIQARNPAFVMEEAHLAIIDALERVERGETERLMIFLAPRAGKSSIVSVEFPAWSIGRNPLDEVMAVSHDESFSARWGSQVRMIIGSEIYRESFPGVRISSRTRGDGAWAVVPPPWIKRTVARPEGGYIATSIGSGIAGRGFNLGIIDDPLNEQTARQDIVVEKINDWYGPGFYTRRNLEGNKIIIMCTRWRDDDLPGWLLERSKNSPDDPYADRWEVVSIPAVLDKPAADLLNKYRGDPRLSVPVCPKYKSGDSFLPRRMPMEEIRRSKSNLANDRAFSALYLQSPTAHDGNIIRRNWWQAWSGMPGKPQTLPEFHQVIQVYDTAFEPGEENDCTARTTWGVFKHPRPIQSGKSGYAAMLLERMNERLTFPQLRELASADYDPATIDAVLIEKRASGHSLIQELKRAGVPVRPVKTRSVKGQKDDLVRAHAASVAFTGGAIFYPEWVSSLQEVVDQCAAFPYAAHDDMATTVFMACIWLRRMWWLETDDDLDRFDDDEHHDDVYGGARRKPKKRGYG